MTLLHADGAVEIENATANRAATPLMRFLIIVSSLSASSGLNRARMRLAYKRVNPRKSGGPSPCLGLLRNHRMTTSPQAIPVRVRVTTLRQEVIKADPEFMQESEQPVEYEFSGGKRKFRGRYKHRGAYAED
jgi:hypothetical protein